MDASCKIGTIYCLTEGTASNSMVTQVTALALRRSDTMPAMIPPGKIQQAKRMISVIYKV